jgi:hypothetical protein
MRRLEIGFLIVLGIIVSGVFYFNIINSGKNLGIQDWDQNFAWTEFTRVSLLNFHQFPLWNPYKCGGSVQFANPQMPVISFQTLFALLFGTVRGIKLSIFFHGVIGFIGFYILARQHKLSYVGSTLAAVIFSFSGITASFLSTGMVVFTSFAYTPYILIFFNRSIQNGKWGIISGALFALSFYAGYHISLLLGIYIFVYTVVTSIVNRTFAPFKALILMVVTSALLMLPKLLLSIQLIRIYPRPNTYLSGYSVNNFLYFLVSQKQNLFNAMRVEGFYNNIDENSIYIGILPCILFLIFFIKNKQGIVKNLPLVVTLLIIFWMMLGNVIHPSLFGIFQKLPIFSSFRVAQRFRFDLIIPLSLLIGLGLDNGVRLFKEHKLASLLSIICLVFIYADLTVFSSENFLSKALIIKNPESQLSRGDVFFQTKSSSLDFEIQKTIQLPNEFVDSSTFIPWSYEYLSIKQNQGVIECYDSLTRNGTVLGREDANYQGEFYLASPVQGVTVENVFWSPNTLIFKISNVEKAINNSLVVNQNFYPGWIVKTDNDTCARASFYKGLLSTRLDSVIDKISFEFNPFLYYFSCK